MSVATITGKNGFLAQKELRDRRVAFVEQFGDSSLTELDGETVGSEDVRQAVMSQGLFSTNSFVVLSNFAKNKQLQETLQDVFESVPTETEFILFDPNLDKRTSFFKSLQKNTELVDCKELDERALVQWVRGESERLGKELGFAEAQFLASRVNLDQWMLFNELQKLSLIEGEITREVIEKLVDESFNETVFNLLDAAFGKQKERALKQYRDMRANRVDEYYIFSMLVWQLHILLVVAYAKDRSAEQIAKDHKLSPFVVKKSQGLLTKTSRSELKSIVAKAVQIDADSKSKGGYSMDAAVDMLIARIASSE